MLVLNLFFSSSCVFVRLCFVFCLLFCYCTKTINRMRVRVWKRVRALHWLALEFSMKNVVIYRLRRQLPSSYFRKKNKISSTRAAVIRTMTKEEVLSIYKRKVWYERTNARLLTKKKKKRKNRCKIHFDGIRHSSPSTIFLIYSFVLRTHIFCALFFYFIVTLSLILLAYQRICWWPLKSLIA